MFAPKKPDSGIARLCGIFGFYDYRSPRARAVVIDFLLTGLSRLEYRGYDSAGFALDSHSPAPEKKTPSKQPANGTSNGTPAAADLPVLVKSSGKIANLRALASTKLASDAVDLKTEFDVHVGIAHTRWATHGPPSTVNSHPHTSGIDGQFTVVHNGIITNYSALKDFLLHRGETFESETDTEVIPKLCKWIYNSLSEPVPFSQLIMDVMSQMQGAYALLVMSTHYPGEMVACKRGSPLIMGVAASSAPVISPTRTFGSGGSAEEGGKDGGAENGRPAKRRPGLECFLASDASAVVEHTKRVIVLEEGDVVALRGGAYEIFNFADRSANGALAPAKPRALETLNMEVEQIMKGGYDHFMQKEIFEQPETVLQSMRGRVRFRPEHAAAAAAQNAHTSPVAWTTGLPKSKKTGAGGKKETEAEEQGTPTTSPSQNQQAAMADISSSSPGTPTGSNSEDGIKLGGLVEHVDAIRTGRRLVLVACGTSYHACLAGRKALEQLVGLPVCLELASDLLDRQAPILRDDTCVFVSQSGETADTLRALQYAKARGALCVGVTNTVGSAIARGTHCGVHINAGAEIGVASTKAYTSQIVVLVMMALALSVDSISKAALREEIIDGLAMLPSAVRTALTLDPEVRLLAERLKGEDSLLVFGRGYNYATALEAALKVKEVALMHSEGILAGEMKHGPLALVDESMPILVVATQDEMHAKMLSVIQQLRARGARLVVLCCTGDKVVEEAAGPDTVFIRVPRVADCLQPVVNAVPLQLLSYHLAVLRGHNVDQPRNLAKSVTVTEEDGDAPAMVGVAVAVKVNGF